MINHERSDSQPLSGITALKSPDALVQRSTPLLSLWRTPFTLTEFKILDAYLARIDSHHPEQRWVRFSKSELEDLLGVQKINLAELREHVKHLGVMVDIDNPSSDGFDYVALFERAICTRDEDGLYQVDLKCTEDAMKYIFNIENIGYLRYKLQSVIPLTSRHSYLLFLYLEKNRYRSVWEVSLEELRSYLGCADARVQFKYFNHHVLKRAQQELQEKTSCRFSYEAVKKGRKIRAIRFTLEPPEPTEAVWTIGS